ncbi:hypothetical protein [Ilumatobacter sp.]|uniref:hypothetical protein n=1 Tax=Ilumatobacter sp. TaxID=1967498 RepID=UPI003AF9CD53
MQKYIQGALFATVAGALTLGAAASLNVNAENLGGGASAVLSCDDEVDVAFQLLENEPELVGAIFVRDISEACLTQLATVSVSNGISAIIADGEAVVDGETLIVPLVPRADYSALVGLSDSVRATDVYEVSVTITGAPVDL